MKITLAVKQNDNSPAQERTFTKTRVLIGRDALACDIVFDGESAKSVSRQHCEMAWSAGTWVVSDLNSSSGTLINGRPLEEPEAIAVGTELRFGANGPMIKVVQFRHLSDISQIDDFKREAEQKPAAPVIAEPPPADIYKNQQTPPPAKKRDAGFDMVKLHFPGGDRPAFAILKRSTVIGRDETADVVVKAKMVSRKHAVIEFDGTDFLLTDSGGPNGTMVNGNRIVKPTKLFHGDEISLGNSGPKIRFDSPSRRPAAAPKSIGSESLKPLPVENDEIVRIADVKPIAAEGPKTIAFDREQASSLIKPTTTASQHLIAELNFNAKKELTVGRDASCDLTIDGLLISKTHAKFVSTPNGIGVQDCGSTNGVFVNGERVSKHLLQYGETVMIGSYLFEIDPAGGILVFDTRARSGIEVNSVSLKIGKNTLLDKVSLVIEPNEFVGILGASGAGKSTLIEVLCGAKKPDSGNVYHKRVDLYRNLGALSQSIGYVMQNETSHDELSVGKTLYYAAKLRSSGDATSKDIERSIVEVLQITGLTDRRELPLKALSGGQRKRVGLAIELLTRPASLFLDEPASGLDPKNEENLMWVCRQIAESGRTVVMTTHSITNVDLFDKVVLLDEGKLIFCGPPQEALKFFGVKSFAEIYKQTLLADQARQKFESSDLYQNKIVKPLANIAPAAGGGKLSKTRLGIFGSIRQWATLTRRYISVLGKDKLSLFILFVQPIVIAIFTAIATGGSQPRDFVYFVLALIAIWFGVSVSAREIVRENKALKRERMINLKALPYFSSKLFILLFIVSFQCILLFGLLKIFDIAGLSSMPGVFFGVPQLWVMIVAGWVGIATGLFISAAVKTQTAASMMIPLILIPQILFSGIAGVPSLPSRIIGVIMPSAWAMDAEKRFSGLDTLEPEGAEPRGRSNGLGLFEFVRTENKKLEEDAKTDLADFKKRAEQRANEFREDLKNGLDPPTPSLDDTPGVPEILQVPTDLSEYVTYKNDWMNEIVSQLVLIFMFGIISIFTIAILKFGRF